ncbi:hypothetical protein BH11MYX1_BH11MYX1_37050 [soil metagenome]
MITGTGFGPINATTIATLTGLRSLLPAYRVVPDNDPQLQYDIMRGPERIGFIVINDDQTVYNVHATSGVVRVEGRPWRAGQAFQDAKQITHCECWGTHPACYKAGEHVAVTFDRVCFDTLDRHAFKALDGLVVERVVWSATPLGDDGRADDEGSGEDAEP